MKYVSELNYEYELIKDGRFVHLRCHYKEHNSIGDVCFLKKDMVHLVKLLSDYLDSLKKVENHDQRNVPSKKADAGG